MTTRVNLERWRGHVAAALERGVPLAQYAREHGLSRHTLYVAHKQMQRASGAATKRQPAKTPRPPPFVAVQVAGNGALLRARLPNGVEVELAELPASAYGALLSVLAGLPCSN